MFARMHGSSRLFVAAALSGFGLFATTNQAQAGDWALSIGLNDIVQPVVAAPVHVVPPPTICERQDRQVWIPAVFDNRQVCHNVPPVIQSRQVPLYDAYGRITGYQQVHDVLQPARTECHTEQVLVREGYYTIVSEQVCTPTWATPVAVAPVLPAYVQPGFNFSFAYDKHDRREHKDFSRRALLRDAVRAGFVRDGRRSDRDRRR